MLAALRRLSALDQNDKRVWVRLLRLLVEKGHWEEARAVGESTMFVDVANPEVHRLYARALARTGRFVSAVYELNSAIVCKPKTKELVEIYGELAKAYAKLKEPEMEKQALEYKTALEKIPSVDKKDDKEEKEKKKGRELDVEET
jgi:predicted Zn-dependent protease